MRSTLAQLGSYLHRRISKRARARHIIANWATATLQDALFLFPEACPACGHREAVQITTNSGFYNDSFHPDPRSEHIIERKCCYCKRERKGESYFEHDHNMGSMVSGFRASSPYPEAWHLPEFTDRHAVGAG